MVKPLVYILLFSQLLVFGTLDRIQKAMEKKEYEKVLELISKGYEKEPKNPGISYYHALLFFERDFVKYNIDTARVAIVRAKRLFDQASPELKQEVIDDGITLEMVNNLLERIRDRAFQNTLNDLSVNAISTFQKKFPNSIYADLLTYKSDSIEFRIAKNSNSQSQLVQFIESHPTSIFKPKADSILDDMRVSELVMKGALKDYYSFLERYPYTRQRKAIEGYILKVSTASHQEERFRDFISFSSSKSLKKKAADLLYYLTLDKNNIQHPFADSLQKVIYSSKNRIYPVMQQGLIGFYDQNGKQQINNLYTDIQDPTKCQLITDDWVFVGSGDAGLIVSKSGQVILKDVDDYRSINKDAGLVMQQGKWYLYHKSGFKILNQPVLDASILANKWIKVKQGDKWGLFTYLGLPIAQSIYDDIYKTESFWVFEKNGLLAVYTEPLILKEIEEKGLSLEFKFDDIELVNKNALIGFRDSRECLLDSTLNFLIPWGNYEINPEASGWYLKSDQGYRLYNKSEAEVMDRHYPYLESNEGWLALKTEKDWMLIPRNKDLQPSREYDSIKLVNAYSAILIKEGSSKLLFSSGEAIPVDGKQVRTFQNHPQFISISDGSKTTLYDENGSQLLAGTFENTVFLNDSLVRVQIRGKQGLIHVNGDWVLNPVFDTIDEKNGLVLTLIKGKIGCYDPLINELIATEYEARVERLGNYYLAKKDGKYGVIDHAKSQKLSFSYDQIQPWNDTTYLVKKNHMFHIVDLNEEPAAEPVESMKLLIKNDVQSIYRYVKNGKYGLLSNTYGELLKSEFTDIFNIGTTEDPLFFADQHLDKAGFHVVSYINQKGELILSKAYTLDEFDKILCDN
ncbi:hypothetical protein [Ekhidna sp.]|uniref:hypothetical protein n=1 Tax=Ekhidna sp. TaxID=2608089 RepID=UPI00351112D4